MAEVGTQIVLVSRFYDTAGQPVDPSDVSFTVLEPDGARTVFTAEELTNEDAVGEFSRAWTIRQPGTHRWLAEGTGAVIVASEAKFHVPAPFVERSL